MTRFTSFIFAAMLLAPLIALHAADLPGLNLHLSPAGNDANPGTASRPLATLAAAQRAARTAVGKKPVTVWLHAGTYHLPETVRFTAEDAGTAEAPVVYAGAPVNNPSSAAAPGFSWIGSRCATGFFRRRHPPDWRWINCS